MVNAAKSYRTFKRILIWRSFVTAKPEPNDLDYSVMVAVDHHRIIKSEHRRFFVPSEARMFYGTDKGFLIIKDYPLDTSAGRLDFICHDTQGGEVGIVEISLYGEFAGGSE